MQIYAFAGPKSDVQGHLYPVSLLHAAAAAAAAPDCYAGAASATTTNPGMV